MSDSSDFLEFSEIIMDNYTSFIVKCYSRSEDKRAFAIGSNRGLRIYVNVEDYNKEIKKAFKEVWIWESNIDK
jgi:hypothetical protein